MSKLEFVLASPERTAASQECKILDWKLCFLCGIDEPKSVQLSKPFAKQGYHQDDPETHGTYKTIANYLNEWQEAGYLSSEMITKISTVTAESSLPVAQTLQKKFVANQAVFHKKCIVKYGREKLKRKQESKKETEGGTSPKKTRRSFTAKNFGQTCFFCDNDDNELISCRTSNLSKHVREWSEYLMDARLIAKLSEGDMMATEAKYHKKCLTNLYNHFKSKKNSVKGEKGQIHEIESKALEDVVKYVKDTIKNSQLDGSTPVFQQKVLADLYKDRIVCYGRLIDSFDEEGFAKTVHSTHLREKIMDQVPGLSIAKKSGLTVAITMDDEVGRALFEACDNSEKDDENILLKAAQIVRKGLKNDEVFDGNVSEERQLQSVPAALLKLVAMMLEGGNPNQILSKTLQKVSVNIAQLIRFNCVKEKRRNQDITELRHSKKNEPPLPVLIGLMVHAKTGKRKLVDELSSQGVSISYERVREIRRSISNQVCRKYNSEGFVCPSELQYNLFTTSAIDNVDHNPTSSTSETSFHGTTISVFQHANVPVTAKMLSFEHFTSGRSERLKLPESYTEIQPTRAGKPEPPPQIEPQTTSTSLLSSGKPVYEEATAWLEKLARNPDSPEERMSFSAFYSAQANPPNSTSSNLLPLIPEPVTAPATVRHATKVVMKIVEEVNPGQQPVITGDQPVYALGKQLQWMFPDDVVWL